MVAIFFPAILEKGGDGFGVIFPDLPGCVSHGTTLQEAARMAEEALQLHLEAMVEHKEQVPEPSELDAVPRDPDIEEAARILVRVERPGQIARVNVTMEEGLLKRIDSAAEENGFTRSGFLAEAARRMMASLFAKGADTVRSSSEGAKVARTRTGVILRKNPVRKNPQRMRVK